MSWTCPPLRLPWLAPLTLYSHDLPVRKGGQESKACVQTLNHKKTAMSPPPTLVDLAKEENVLGIINSSNYSMNSLAISYIGRGSET